MEVRREKKKKCTASEAEGRRKGVVTMVMAAGEEIYNSEAECDGLKTVKETEDGRNEKPLTLSRLETKNFTRTHLARDRMLISSQGASHEWGNTDRRVPSTPSALGHIFTTSFVCD